MNNRTQLDKLRRVAQRDRDRGTDKLAEMTPYVLIGDTATPEQVPGLEAITRLEQMDDAELDRPWAGQDPDLPEFPPEQTLELDEDTGKVSDPTEASGSSSPPPSDPRSSESSEPTAEAASTPSDPTPSSTPSESSPSDGPSTGVEDGTPAAGEEQADAEERAQG